MNICDVKSQVVVNFVSANRLLQISIKSYEIDYIKQYINAFSYLNILHKQYSCAKCLYILPGVGINQGYIFITPSNDDLFKIWGGPKLCCYVREKKQHGKF